MQLDKEAIEEFKEIYRKEFGKEISDEEAYDMGIRLITLIKLTCRPILGDDLQKQADSNDPNEVRQAP